MTAGYNFMYLSRVARPGDQINETLNPSFIPSSPTLLQLISVGLLGSRCHHRAGCRILIDSVLIRVIVVTPCYCCAANPNLRYPRG